MKTTPVGWWALKWDFQAQAELLLIGNIGKKGFTHLTATEADRDFAKPKVLKFGEPFKNKEYKIMNKNRSALEGTFINKKSSKT